MDDWMTRFPIKWGYPIAGWFLMENPNLHEMDDLGGSILGIIEIHGGGSPVFRNQHHRVPGKPSGKKNRALTKVA